MAKTATAAMPADMAKEQKKYMAESDLRTLIDAEKIKKDKARFGAAMKCHAEQMKVLTAIGNGKAGGAGKAGAEKKTETY